VGGEPPDGVAQSASHGQLIGRGPGTGALHAGGVQPGVDIAGTAEIVMDALGVGPEWML